MTITKIVNNERVICESSYYEWWQTTQPSFKDVLIKICQECGTTYDVVYNPLQISSVSTVEEYSCSIHGVVVVITTHSHAHKSAVVKTRMKTTYAKHDWVDHHIDHADLFIPYFETFLSNLRNVWYDQYKVDTGY